MLQLLVEQYDLSLLLPHREKVFALLFPHPVYMPHPISKWPTRPLSHSLYPGYKSGLRTPVQHRFSLELDTALTASPTLMNFISLSFWKSVLNIHGKDWCWNWNSNTLATWSKELTHWKRPWCWERSKAGREGNNRGWDAWMASLTQWASVWVSSES